MWDKPVTYCDERAAFASLHRDVVIIRDTDGNVLGQTRHSANPTEAAAEVRRQGFEISQWHSYSEGLWARVRQARWRGDSAW